MKIVGHRGAAGRAPENTLASFRRAWELGADMAELDVRLTADGHVVALHDATLDRTTTGSGPLSARTLAEAQALDAGVRFAAEFVGERVPTLAEVLQSGGGDGSDGTRWLIELKSGDDPAGLVERALAAIRAAGAETAVRLISFDEAMLAEARRQAPAIPRGMIAGRNAAALLAAAARHECVSVHPAYALATPDFLAAARAAGYLINTWTINTTADLARVAALDIDEATTDDPELALDVLRAASED
jgi:glycerophosphoryl diester phosphodiesterase